MLAVLNKKSGKNGEEKTVNSKNNKTIQKYILACLRAYKINKRINKVLDFNLIYIRNSAVL